MPKDAKGLVTISHNTNLRDFSQGVFRMRNILDEQNIDIIIDKNTFNIIQNNFNIIKSINKNDGSNCADTINDEIKQFIFKFIKKNQDKIDKQKKKNII
jgi:hypothetical protein